MNIRKCMTVSSVAVFVAALLSATASAVELSASSSIADNTFLDGNLSGQFNINSLLSPASDYVLPYTINSAMATFRFQDDGDLHYSGTSGYTTYDYDDAEGVTAITGGQAASGSTPYFSSTVYTGTVVTGSYPIYSYHCGWLSCWYEIIGYANSTANTYRTDYGYTGAFAITQQLATDALADLSADGHLDFMLNVTGDLNLLSASLDFDITPSPAPPVMSPVPEPSTWLLMGSGLAGLAAVRKRFVGNAEGHSASCS